MEAWTFVWLTSNCTGYEWQSGGGRILSTLNVIFAGCMMVVDGVDVLDAKYKSLKSII